MITAILVVTLIALMVYVGSHRLSGMQVSVALVVVATGVFLAMFPQASTDIARRLNVGRGTDLLFYCAILAGLFVTANFYFRFKREEARMIELTRRVALMQAERDYPSRSGK